MRHRYIYQTTTKATRAYLQGVGDPYDDGSKHLRRGVDLEDGNVLVRVIPLMMALASVVSHDCSVSSFGNR